jgi:hypothetical protein
MGLLLCTKEAMASMKSYNISGYIINVNSQFDHKVPINLDRPPYKNSHGLRAVREEITALKTEKIRMTVGGRTKVKNRGFTFLIFRTSIPAWSARKSLDIQVPSEHVVQPVSNLERRRHIASGAVHPQRPRPC